MNKFLKILYDNIWKVFVQIILNTFLLFLILILANSKALYIIFGVSIGLQLLGMCILGYFGFVKGSLVNVTNNKYLILDAKDMPIEKGKV